MLVVTTTVLQFLTNSGRLRGPDGNAWRAGFWPAGRVLDIPGLDVEVDGVGGLWQVWTVRVTVRNRRGFIGRFRRVGMYS